MESFVPISGRKAGLMKRFQEEPCAKLNRITLDSLGLQCAEASMPVHQEVCTAGGIVQGGVLAVLADYAGVYVAMMNDEGFTPLSSLHLEYFRPTVLARDKKAIARAIVIHKAETRIVVEVKVENENRQLKAGGTLIFARRLKNP